MDKWVFPLRQWKLGSLNFLGKIGRKMGRETTLRYANIPFLVTKDRLQRRKLSTGGPILRLGLRRRCKGEGERERERGEERRGWGRERKRDEGEELGRGGGEVREVAARRSRELREEERAEGQSEPAQNPNFCFLFWAVDLFFPFVYVRWSYFFLFLCWSFFCFLFTFLCVTCFYFWFKF